MPTYSRNVGKAGNYRDARQTAKSADAELTDPPRRNGNGASGKDDGVDARLITTAADKLRCSSTIYPVAAIA
jgi:hypothetical protein